MIEALRVRSTAGHVTRYASTRVGTRKDATVEVEDWRQRISASPEVMAGKPTIRGTRITVEFLLDLFAGGWTQERVLEAYPHLTPEDISAAFKYAADCIDDQRHFTFDVDVA